MNRNPIMIEISIISFLFMEFFDIPIPLLNKIKRELNRVK